MTECIFFLLADALFVREEAGQLRKYNAKRSSLLCHWLLRYAYSDKFCLLRILAAGGFHATPCILGVSLLTPSSACLPDTVSAEFHRAKFAIVTSMSTMLQQMMLFSALLHGTVLFLLSYTLVASRILRILSQAYVLGASPSWKRQFFCALGVLGAAAVLVGEVTVLKRPLPPLRSCLALVAWTAAKALESAWESLKRMAGGIEQAAGPRIGPRLAQIVDGEEALTAGSALMYRTMVPALPALALGFAGLEGNELIEHELSVPAVTAILVSVGCFLCAAISGLLLQLHLAPRLKSGLEGLAGLVAIVFDIAAVDTRFSLVCVLGALISCVASSLEGILT
uniref:Uncharacterized protein n=1 Tax=Tetraselmis sp. GSL018 TaxID=582737 RepID=A0A061RWV7_9CHLO|mmetsp:Transcript_14445/g.34241  ORF Transcript_14445/g.34241 Transcript_14445/m.34241 type:complete len:339 (+) Transcript_14445:712-1728(+)